MSPDLNYWIKVRSFKLWQIKELQQRLADVRFKKGWAEPAPIQDLLFMIHLERTRYNWADEKIKELS